MHPNPLKHLLISPVADDDSGEFIPLLSPEEENEMQKEGLPEILPILPVKNTVLFPGVVIPITVGRQKSIKLVKKAYRGDRIIGVVAQSQPNQEEPGFDNIFKIGTVARILKMLVLPDGNTTIIIQGQRRFELLSITETEPFLIGKISLLGEKFPDPKKKETKALMQSLKDTAKRILKINPSIPQEAQVALENIESLSFLTHFLSSNLGAEVQDKQFLLELSDGNAKATKLLEHLMKDLQMLELKQEIQSKVNMDIDQQQRDYFIRQQIKALQEELGMDSPDQEIENLRAKGLKKKWPEAVAKHFNKELDKMHRINPQAAEYPVALNYLELLAELPWDETTKDNFNLKRAKRILDADHYGLDKIKDRILEYLAVLKLKNNMKAPILCLYGPPGIGKTSLGRSIAKALGRKYVRMSLGGLRDEAEIRGHRKTYIGAMPGRIIQHIKKAKSSNPVFILDEIDKIGSDFRGDPASALLEVLDPEQNHTFADNYLELDYDLSKVMFIATCNSLESIHPALRDRMEIIEMSGYTMEEKLEIAKRHLIPRQLEEHGIKPAMLKLGAKVVHKIIADYTRESGVRNLERKIAAVIRAVARKIAMDETYDPNLTVEDVQKMLGTEVFDTELYQDNRYAGVVTGLAWTSVGGEILFIESSLSKGRGKLTLSGQLGDVMKESAVAALSYLKANAEKLGLDFRVFDHYDLHVHVPAGAVPKDGPSAGITMFLSMASIFTQRMVKDKVAMTGEITLRGKILPVGGIKEKLLAARRSGIREVLLSKRNKKDVDEIEPTYLAGLQIHFVDHVDDVLALALLDKKAPNAITLTLPDKSASAQIAHLQDT
jgi:ATP-dependent Lon protease